MTTKKFVAVLVFFVSVHVEAMTLIPAYNTNYCPDIDHIVPIVRSSQSGAHLWETHRLMNIVSIWNQAFRSNNDTIVMNSSNGPLCVGLMDDGGQPNAVAVGKNYLLMGTSLISMLESEYGKNSVAKDVKEQFVLAHEYAHILQNLHKLKFDYVLPMLSIKIKEQHADCMAAFLMEIANSIPIGQEEDLGSFVQELADAHIVGDHGTAEQRLEAYKNGIGSARVQRVLLKQSLSTQTSTGIVRECAVFYRPTNLQ